ncbi:winged helix DNA-binding domain-containing protein [Actinoplanes bogorensis]|uniref:Winged helix DNA-binding domain-containing protein n=1 Tax=Paractinoplanes bogorensis TaxID=1610840 RepID=A0ABS5YXY3_9ACTN|nr:winged helix DNA-binding domain-containing protein [Actinoplanes bogorensis]MBU2668305.1 winged helix DNA-binding domain-containing protein [Actinoplanes bogorensis]
MTVLDNRALNRALMARQMLDRRHTLSVVDTIEHLVGLQAQEPLEPYVGLWSRLEGFRPEDLVEPLESRQVVRTLLMRRTIHLVTAADCLGLRALHQPMLDARMRAVWRRDLEGVDLAELAADGLDHFQKPSTLPEAGRAVGGKWPSVPARVLGDALSVLVPLVQVTPRGVWGQKAPARNVTIASWLGAEPAPACDADELVLRYLRAFGPAASADIRAWSGLSGLRASIDRLRPQLRTFRDVRGRELLDVPDAPLPDGDTPVPPRFLPAFDNVVLGFDDRSRIIDDEHRRHSVEGARFVLLDGRVAGLWKLDGTDLRVSLFAARTNDQSTRTGDLSAALNNAQSARDVEQLEAEGDRLLAWHGLDGRTVVEIHR